MNIINKNAKLLTKAVEAGLDPFKVELADAPSKVQGNKGTIPVQCLSFAPSNISFLFCFLVLNDLN